jgi:formiminotetrahydrofolate cyclodeaminase
VHPLSEVVSDLLAGLTVDEHVPGGGAVSAVTAGLAATLVAKLARLSESGWTEAVAAAVQAEILSERAGPLAEEDSAAYQAALDVLAARDSGDRAVAEAVDRAAEVPLRIVRAAADVALLAAEVAESGDPGLAADAAVAAALADGAARGAAQLVAVNLTRMPEDPRVEEADSLATVARAAVRRACAACG